MHRIDINCDMGEGYGVYQLGNDEALLPLINSANIACGFHAGDASIMRRTVKLCLQHEVAIGAHPGFPDRLGFGRRSMQISAEEIYDIILYQTGALQGIAQAEGGVLQHVKPHGALYNMASKDAELAEAVAQAVYKLDPGLILFGLSGSELIRAAEKIGLRAAQEVFADRTYLEDGTLVPRDVEGAMLEDAEASAEQVLLMIKSGKVTTLFGKSVPLEADTVCIHGDHPDAVQIASVMKERLESKEVQCMPVGIKKSSLFFDNI